MVKKRNPTIVKQGEQEPIAIIGIGCRFPGGSNNPAAFWDLLINAKDAIVDVPKDRWDIRKFYDPDKPGKMYVRSGGFLQERIDQFDALFFGISPREAACLDPQQRVLLEVAWEALEDAGLVPQQLAGSDTGVYIGGFMLDNTLTQVSYLNRNLIGTHTAVSFTQTILSNRLSYVFDLRGPSITMDTACSSSLVALHEASQSLWRGECSLALVGGVNIMHRPETPIVMCKGQLLASDGHSKSFDERADGYGRGEGAGIVVLKPLSAAQQDGDDIYALVRGTGVNQDGRTSGITVPNPESQEALVRQVCDQANVIPQHVRYVEAHGTGTAVGDPLECNALGTVLGQDRSSDNACLVGSVKANIGHLEAAAGVASVIKTSLCLKHKQIPPVANLENPNPNIPFETLGLRLPRKLEPMPIGEGPAYIGINSFGYGGTNAHAILEEAPVTEMSLVEDAPGTPYLLPLSARSEKALSALAQSYIDFLSEAKAPPLRDICYSASVRREHHNHRLALIADSRDGMVEQLQSFVNGQSGHLLTGQIVPGQFAPPVFVFTGMGPQWWAMGHELLQHEPVFRKVVEECDAIFQRLAGWSILAEMKADENHSKMGETQIAQPANFVLQAALTALWRSWGIEPAAIVGHSVGDVTAAYIAGILDLEDAIRVSYQRSRIQKQVVGQGKMLAVGLTADEAQALLAGYEEQVSFAAINSPSAVTLSGESAALEEIAAKLETKGVFNRFLRVELAYHSPVMDQLKDEMRESLSMLRPKAPSIPFYSTVLGQLVNEATCDAEYWCQNIRQPVLFAKSIENLLNDGYQLFLEIGPHPVLSTSIKECLSHHGAKGNVISSLHRKQPERATLREALGSLYTLNSPIDFKKIYGIGDYVRLPSYPWQRETYWNESEESLYDRLGNSEEHPLLGQRLTTPTSNNLSWESALNQNFLPYLVDHRIEGLVILPGAAYIEIGLAIHKETDEKKACALEGIELHRALVIDANDEPVLHLSYDKKTHEYAVHSRTRDDKSNWTLHATGSLSLLQISGADQLNLDAIRERCQASVESDTLYAQLHEIGLQYGPYFRGIRHLWKGKDEVLAQIEGHQALSSDDDNYLLHPTLLDASFQSLIAILDDNVAPYVPVSICQLRFHASPKTHCWSYGRLTKRSAGFIEADITLCDDDGKVLVEVNDLRCQALTVGKSEELEDWKQWTYDFVWKQAEKTNATETSPRGQWLLFIEQGHVGEQLADQLLSHGAEGIIQVRPGIAFQQEDATHFQIRRDSREDMQRILETVQNGDRVVYLWGLDAPTDKDDPTGTADGIACLHLIQALAQVEQLESIHFFLITCGAQPIHHEERSIALAQTPLVGLVRVAINEHPNIHFHLVDIDPDKEANNFPLLVEELLAENLDEEIALRGTDRFVHRLVQTQVKDPEPISATPGFPYELEIGTPGLIESLRFREKQRRVPGPGEIEIEVHATSLNFKDVLKVTNQLHDETLEKTFYGDSLGMEAAGVIVRVGEGVKDYCVGDAIIASVPGAFSSYVTLPLDSIFLVPKLGNISYEEGVGVPRVFVTAYYGLHHVAQLQPGEKVLIHAATGGVGMAAIQVARWIGAEIFATVDNPDKYDYLSSLGIKHIMDFRSLDFADQILALTDGNGVDVILNALPGEIFIKSLSVLASFGRFIEIGKLDIVNNNRIPIRSFHCNLSSFAVISLDCLMVRRPKLFRQMLNEIWGRFMVLDFTPLPVKVFPAAQIVDAFNYMAHSKHIGKIAISMRDQQAFSVLPMAVEKTLFQPESTYMITGGFGGFGLEVAKWMMALGVKNLVLVGRRGAATTEARQTVQELEKAGTKVFAAAADITQESQVAKLMSEIDATMPPLKGIMHTAAVLDDAPIVELNDAQFSKVMAPKALGAWHLHQHTQNLPLDFFVLFSSVSAQIGNSRQGNYVAANVFLDALAHHRQANGLPATSINWGALADVGMAARNEEVGEYLERMGIKGITPVQAMKALAHILYWKPSQNSVIDVDWTKWGQFNPVWAASPRFSHLIAKKPKKEEDSAINILRRNLLGMDAEERKEMLAFLMAELVAETMRLPTDKVNFHQSMTNMGMDSLMATELQNAIHLKFDVKLSSLELLNGNTTITWIAEQLIMKMDIAGDKTAMEDTQTDDSSSSKEVMEHIDDLSNEEVDDLLNKLLEQKEA